MNNDYDAWRLNHGNTQGDLQEIEEYRWHLAHKKANRAMMLGLDDCDAITLKEEIDEFVLESIDDENSKDLSKLLFDVAMGQPVNSNSNLIEDIRELILEELATKFYKEHS